MSTASLTISIIAIAIVAALAWNAFGNRGSGRRSSDRR
jgi:hypothetical protein